MCLNCCSVSLEKQDMSITNIKGDSTCSHFTTFLHLKNPATSTLKHIESASSIVPKYTQTEQKHAGHLLRMVFCRIYCIYKWYNDKCIIVKMIQFSKQKEGGHLYNYTKRLLVLDWMPKISIRRQKACNRLCNRFFNKDLILFRGL